MLESRERWALGIPSLNAGFSFGRPAPFHDAPLFCSVFVGSRCVRLLATSFLSLLFACRGQLACITRFQIAVCPRYGNKRAHLKKKKTKGGGVVSRLASSRASAKDQDRWRPLHERPKESRSHVPPLQAAVVPNCKCTSCLLFAWASVPVGATREGGALRFVCSSLTECGRS